MFIIIIIMFWFLFYFSVTVEINDRNERMSEWIIIHKLYLDDSMSTYSNNSRQLFNRKIILLDEQKKTLILY